MSKGIGGHQSSAAQTTTWLTPQFIIAALPAFDLDPCAAPEPRPFPTAKTHYTKAEGNGLHRPWFGSVWLNPPYGAATGAWLDRLANHRCGMALIFARTETKHFFRAIWSRADAILFIRNRLTFLHPDGTPGHDNSGAPSVLVSYGAEQTENLHNCAIDGHFLAISAPTTIFIAQKALQHSSLTWRQLLRAIFEREKRALTLSEIYDLVCDHPKGHGKAHVNAKIRQTLNRGGFTRQGYAQYALAL